jgi:hypothetical protein
MATQTATSEEKLKSFSLPKQVTDVDLAFGGRIADLMPRYEELPDDFRSEQDPFSKIVNGWFFNGLNTSTLTAKAGIDKSAALRHCRAIMCSFDPSHEHKIAGVAWLMSQWFEAPQS